MGGKIVKKFLVILFVCFIVPVAEASEPSNRLIRALMKVEVPSGNIYATGDRWMLDPAFGILQIRQPAMDDVYPGHRAQECLGNVELSKDVCRKYIARYATKKLLGHEPTDEDRARIWNGGPKGWKKESTRAYWAKVQKALARLDREG